MQVTQLYSVGDYRDTVEGAGASKLDGAGRKALSMYRASNHPLKLIMEVAGLMEARINSLSEQELNNIHRMIAELENNDKISQF